MGVLACDRFGCENIMCERVINNKFYICESCYNDLVAYKNSWTSIVTVGDVWNLIETFMEKDPDRNYMIDPYVEDEFNSLIVLRKFRD